MFKKILSGILGFLAIAGGIMFVISLIFFFFGSVNNETGILEVSPITMGIGLSCFTFFGTFYYVVKACLIYIEKNEGKK